MQIHDVTRGNPPRLKRWRVGRGPASGAGKTCGAGQKGYNSRSGYSMPAWFEGGTMPLVRRIPKRGFSNARFKKDYAPVNLSALAKHFKDGETVDPETLRRRGLVTDPKDGIKVLGGGTLDKKLAVKAHAFSASAAKRIVEAGGTVEELGANG
jgi:large subunit ribosomal protein L15